jgi:hypothetical protein
LLAAVRRMLGRVGIGEVGQAGQQNPGVDMGEQGGVV